MPAHECPATSGDQPNHDGFDDDIAAVTDDRDVHTDGPIYSHGYALRVLLLGTREAALAALGRIDWGPSSPKWVHAQLKLGQRWIVRGSTYVTHAKPRNRRLAMYKLNSAWRTNLYSLIVDDDGDKIAVTFHGVRRPDVERVLAGTMGLGPFDYRIEHYTAIERYFVLAPHEAFRLAQALEGQASKGYGSMSRKRYLLRNLDVPMVVGHRARRTAALTIYRISAGATAQFKVELRLKGRSRDRKQFSEDDIPKLDDVLEQLINEHDLHPVRKPARWEPATPHRWRRDGRLALISQKAYRGTAVDKGVVQAAQVCHTPCLVFSTGTPSGSRTSLPPEYIRYADESRSASLASPPAPSCGKGHQGWRRLVEDVDRYEGYLSEVILSPDQDPAPCVQALIDRYGDEVGIGSICYGEDGFTDSWGSIERLAALRPLEAESKVLVVVVDHSVVMAVEDAVYAREELSLAHARPGPLYPAYWNKDWGPAPYEKAVAALLTPLFSELRAAAETTGVRIVTITTDYRPQHGRGDLRPTHHYRDGRVRSHVGDAGRYHCHLRYLVDTNASGRPWRITLAKDEGEGLPGRMIWG